MIIDNFFPLFLKKNLHLLVFGLFNSNSHTPSNMEIRCFRFALKFWRFALSWNNNTR